MTDVKWVKLKVGMFDGESFKKIKRAKIGGEKFRDKLTAVWFELMDFAGKCNHAGAFINSREIPFSSIDEIAIMIDREPEELQLCMQFFVAEGMVEIVDNIYQLSNWTQYQNEEGLARIREQNRIRQANFKARKALQAANEEGQEDDSNEESNVTDNVTDALPSISISNSNSNNSNSNSLIEIEGCGEKEEKPKSIRIDYMEIKTMYNELCPSLPSCVAMSDARKTAIKARFTSGYTMEHFRTLFQKAGASSFLKGCNDRNWIASFDWLIKDSNMAKVLGGNYDDRQPQPAQRPPQQPQRPQREKTFMDMVREMEANGGGDVL
ncbi:MAG: phage replisome organizer N-terminal domain-containing protein [Oscillospiraceae bacterium]|nr:phage replisome organizer N-terminal domain-containing protein [Oscillospiraceae bacterium]